MKYTALRLSYCSREYIAVTFTQGLMTLRRYISGTRLLQMYRFTNREDELEEDREEVYEN